MIKAVIFDIDGTMYDYEVADQAGKQALRQYCEEVLGLPGDQFAAVFKQADQLAVSRIGYRCAAIHNRMLRYQCMLEILDQPLFPHTRIMYHKYWDTFIDRMEVFPGLPEWMAELKAAGISVGVGTNMTAYIQYVKLERLGLADYIDWIVTSEEAGVEKPERKFFEMCIAKSGFTVDECLFVGDTPEADYEGSRACGMKALLVAPDGEGADVIRSYRDCLGSAWMEII